MKLRHTILALVLAGSLFAAIGYAVFGRWLDTPLAISGAPLLIDIARGEALATTTRGLAARGVLDHPRWLQAYARYMGTDARIKAGEYQIPAGTTPRGLLRLLESGAVVQHSFTIVEGWTFRDLRRALERHAEIAKTLAGRDDAAVMAALDDSGMPPEGLFFPDTYLFTKGTADREILRQARERMRRELAAVWKERAEGLPIGTPYQALTLASIVEKETALAAERTRIAGVFALRLERGIRLQTDPTVIYGLGASFDGNLRRADLDRDGPYNTYTRTGLPPTPIALPGTGALRAATRPDRRGELYFVATGLPDGSHTFSRTLAEHQAAVKTYLERYRQRRQAAEGEGNAVGRDAER